MREYIITSLLIGFGIAIVLNALFSIVNRLGGVNRGFSFIRFGSLVCTGFVFSVLAAILR